MSLMYLRRSGTREGRVERPRTTKCAGRTLADTTTKPRRSHSESWHTCAMLSYSGGLLRSLRVSFPSKLKGYSW